LLRRLVSLAAGLGSAPLGATLCALTQAHALHDLPRGRRPQYQQLVANRWPALDKDEQCLWTGHAEDHDHWRNRLHLKAPAHDPHCPISQVRYGKQREECLGRMPGNGTCAKAGSCNTFVDGTYHTGAHYMGNISPSQAYTK
jgi:hypothetical protein